MKELKAYWDPADMSVAVKADTTIKALNKKVAKDGLRFPLWVDENQSLEDLFLNRRWLPASLRFNSLADSVMGMRWELPGGKEVQLGARVIKNVAGFDMVRFLCQSRGRLGKPTLMALRLRPLAETEAALAFEGDLPTLRALEHKILSSSWAHVIDSLTADSAKGKVALTARWQADKGQTGLIHAWLKNAASDAGVTAADPGPYVSLRGIQVELQGPPSRSLALAEEITRRYGGRALGLGGLGTTLWTPETDAPLERKTMEWLEKRREELAPLGGHVIAPGVKPLKDPVAAAWEKKLKESWEALA